MNTADNVSIRPATKEERQRIHAQLQPYLIELAGLTGEIMEGRDSQGIYHYPYLDNYWQETNRYPYFLLVGDETAGFALVRRDIDHWEMTEFYVKPEFRHRGIGYKCATLILREHPGTWFISFNKVNKNGMMLWHKVAVTLAVGRVATGKNGNSHTYLQFSTM